MSIMRIGRAELRVLNLEESINYYTNIIGLELVGRSEGRAYLKAWDEYDHHSLVLQEADSPGLDHFAFKVQMKRILSITKDGSSNSVVQLNGFPRELDLLREKRFALRCQQDTKWNFITTFNKWVRQTGTLNPHPFPDVASGMAPHRLDHVLLTGEDVKSVTRLFTEALGIFQSEKIETLDGEDMVGSFMHAQNGKPHDIAFIKGPDNKLHHAAFKVDNWYDVLKAADLLARYDVPIEVSPTRHAITRAETTYFFDPSGNRNEAYSGGYITYPDFPTITWTEDKIAQGIFYHRREMRESFMKALT